MDSRFYNKPPPVRMSANVNTNIGIILPFCYYEVQRELSYIRSSVTCF